MKILVALFITACLLSCKKKMCCAPPVSNEPLPLFFIMKNGNQKLLDSTVERMKIYYYQKGAKKYLNDVKAPQGEDSSHNNDGRMAASSIGVIGVADSVKNFYFEYPDNTTDTLLLDYKTITEDEANNNPCRCLHPLHVIKFNGKVPTKDTSYKYVEVYIFNKQ